MFAAKLVPLGDMVLSEISGGGDGPCEQRAVGAGKQNRGHW